MAGNPLSIMSVVWDCHWSFLSTFRPSGRYSGLQNLQHWIICCACLYLSQSLEKFSQMPRGSWIQVPWQRLENYLATSQEVVCYIHFRARLVLNCCVVALKP